MSDVTDVYVAESAKVLVDKKVASDLLNVGSKRPVEQASEHANRKTQVIWQWIR